MSDREFQKTGQTIGIVQAGLKHALARGDTKPVESEVKELLNEMGIKLTSADPDFGRLSLAILKTYVRALDDLGLRQSGDVIDTPPRPSGFVLPAGQSDQDNPPLSQVFEMYKSEKQRLSPKTISDFASNIRRFIELHGDLGVRDITRKHCRQFKEAMIRFPVRLPKSLSGSSLPVILERTGDDPSVPRLNSKTVNEKALASLSAVLGWADEQGLRDDNPARGLKIKGGKFSAGSRLPYTIEDLNLIFQFPIFTEGERPREAEEKLQSGCRC